MPSRQHSFRIGEISSGDMTFSTRKIYQQINPGIRGNVGNRKGIRQLEYSKSSEVVYLMFVKEDSTNLITLDAQNEDQQQEVYPRRAMKFIILPNGKYLYESVQGVSDSEAVEYISDQTNYNLSGEEIESVSRKLMLDFFNTHLARAKKVRVDEIGEHPPNPGPIRKRLRQIVEEFGKVIEIQENSVGRDANADLRDNELAYATTELSDPDIVRGEDKDGRTEELNSSGIFRLRYNDEEMNSEEEAELLTGRAKDVLGDTVSDSSGGSSDQTEDAES